MELEVTQLLEDKYLLSESLSLYTSSDAEAGNWKYVEMF
jgi:hypothetical protein